MRRKLICSPFSAWRQLWDVLATIALIITCIQTPLELAFFTHSALRPNELIITQRVIDWIFAIDIIISFNTSYFNTEKNSFTTDRKKIAIRYLKTWFFIDLVAVIDFEWLFQVFIAYDESIGSINKVAKIARFYRAIKLFRLLKMTKLAKEKAKIHTSV